jgi:hypothetical protein
MRDLKGEPGEGAEKPKPSPLGYSGGPGWVVASLLIVGTSLALASVAWFLVGLILSTQPPAAPRFDRHEGAMPPSLRQEPVPVSCLSPVGEENEADADLIEA